MKPLIRVIFFAALALSSTTIFTEKAKAEPYDLTRATAGYLYFNMPGADMTRHDGELRNCIANWTGGIIPGHSTFSVGQSPYEHPIGDMIGQGVQDAMMSGWERARKQINIEHCMVVKGWRLVRLGSDEGARLAKLTQKDLATALQPLVAAESPRGDIVRIWANEEIFQNTLVAKSPANATRTMLSIAAISPDNPELPGISSVDPGNIWPTRTTRTDVLERIRPVALNQAVMPEPGQTLLIYTVRTTKKKRMLFFLERQSTDPQTGADSFGVMAAKQFVLGAKGGAATIGKAELVQQSDGSFMANVAVLVPAGIWYIQGGHLNMDNCLGAPAFQAASGAVVYLGTFDSTQNRLSLSMDMTQITNAISGLPIVMTSAQWRNGFTYPCGQMSMYAFEFDGLPFLPGYQWGSMAQQKSGNTPR